MNNENKKSKVGLIIAIVLIILLILFLVWFFVLRDKGTKNTPANNEPSTQTEETTKETNTTKEAYEYDYKDGVLTQIVDEDGKPKQTDFVIDGIILVGNRHSYYGMDDTTGVIENFVKQGYKKEGINSSFYLNEYIGFYVDTKYKGSESDVKILVTPHKSVEEYEKMTSSQLTTLAEDVHMDYPEGQYDILFTYKGEIAYFINITETIEEAE